MLMRLTISTTKKYISFKRLFKSRCHTAKLTGSFRLPLKSKKLIKKSPKQKRSSKFFANRITLIMLGGTFVEFERKDFDFRRNDLDFKQFIDIRTIPSTRFFTCPTHFSQTKRKLYGSEEKSTRNKK